MVQDYLISQDRPIAEVAVSDPEVKLSPDTITIPVKLCNLPPLNAIANQVLALSTDPEVNFGKLSAIMNRDPAFAADVLFLANSSLFGFSQRMHVLRHAIAVLGLDRIQALAVTVAMRGFTGQPNALVRQCWQHSAACALVCEAIAPVFGVTGDVAYTVGLMHDIGLLGFVKCYPQEAQAVLNDTFETTGQVLAAERAMLNVDHSQAGGWLVKNWALPSTFAECCEHHHDPLSPRDSELLKVVKAGCRIADALSFAAFKYSNSLSYDEVIDSLAVDRPQAEFPSGTDLHDSVEARLANFT